MSALADRPDEEGNKPLSDYINFEDEGIQLPIEKQFSHTLFCQKIQTISHEDALDLLAKLHKLYLAKDALFLKMARQEFSGNM